MTALNPLPFPDIEQIALAVNRAFELDFRYGHMAPTEMLERVLRDEYKGRICLVSSFGTESAALLHMVAEIEPATPILFVDTCRLFGETLRYRDKLAERLGLTDVRDLRPDPTRLAAFDQDELLFSRQPDLCCRIRKVEPLQRALRGFEAWITGRKAFQNDARSGLPVFEAAEGRVKVNPLIGWSRAYLEAYFKRHDLPRHPLEAEGFLSIGCMPCTDRVAPGEDARAGRWRGLGKTECGIHLGSGI
jgi:phosphoadenosine phosphosulfate reductase